MNLATLMKPETWAQHMYDLFNRPDDPYELARQIRMSDPNEPVDP